MSEKEEEAGAETVETKELADYLDLGFGDQEEEAVRAEAEPEELFCPDCRKLESECSCEEAADKENASDAAAAGDEKKVGSETADDSADVKTGAVAEPENLLLKKYEELQQQMQEMQTSLAAKDAELKQQKLGKLDLIGDEDVNELVSDKDKLNALLARVVQEAQSRGGDTVQLVTEQINKVMALKQIADDFYKENPELRPVEKMVGQVAREIYTADNTKSVEVVFAEAGKQVREVLGIKAKVVTEAVKDATLKEAVKDTRNGGKPARVKQGGKVAEKGKTKLTKEQLDILETLNL